MSEKHQWDKGQHNPNPGSVGLLYVCQKCGIQRYQRKVGSGFAAFWRRTFMDAEGNIISENRTPPCRGENNE